MPMDNTWDRHKSGVRASKNVVSNQSSILKIHLFLKSFKTAACSVYMRKSYIKIWSNIIEYCGFSGATSKKG